MATIQVSRTATSFKPLRASAARYQSSVTAQLPALLTCRSSISSSRASLLREPFLPSIAPSKKGKASHICASISTGTPINTEPISTGENGANGSSAAPVLVDIRGAPLTASQSEIPPPPAARALNARQVYAAAAKLAVLKSKLTNTRIFLQAVVAGIYIALGGALFLTVGGACPGMLATNPGLHSYFKGLIGLPFGLTLTIFSGMELFTGNTFIMTAGALDGKISTKEVIRNWIFSYAGNFVGSLMAVWAFNVAQILPHAASQATSIGLSVAKTSFPLGTVFMKGILCNWMVCMAVWIAIASTDGVSKYVGMFVTISSFVAMGFEHSVANMFIIPYGMLLGANVSWSQYLLGNLLPVSLGNLIGGAFCVAGVLGYFFSENLNSPKEVA